MLSILFSIGMFSCSEAESIAKTALVNELLTSIQKEEIVSVLEESTNCTFEFNSNERSKHYP